MSGINSSLGIEIEFTNIDQNELWEFLNKGEIRGANIVNDASCTRTRLVIGDVTISDQLLRNNPPSGSWASRRVSGGEFVSPIIYSSQTDKDWFKPIEKVINFMTAQGEKPSLTAGIHIHINVGGTKNVNIEFLTSLIKIWRKVEAAVYRITSAEMGYSRGAEQLSYCYYRPLVPIDGPAVVRDGSGNARPCFDSQKLLEAKTVEEFFQALGRSDNTRGHYWATKYHALNLQSVISKGTVELRTGNFTNQPRYLYAWIRLFQTMLGLAWASYVKPLEIDQFPDLPLGYNGNFSIDDLLQIIPIREDEVVKTLMELWDITQWSPKVEGYQWSHLGHGLGRRMQETIADFNRVNPKLVPDILKDETIHRPEEFAKDTDITAMRGMNEGEGLQIADRPVRRQRTPFTRAMHEQPTNRAPAIATPVPVDTEDDDDFDDDEDYDDDDE